VRNENALKEMYKRQQIRAWRLINDEALLESELKQCYDVVKDLNKKMKWLREIESENITCQSVDGGIQKQRHFPERKSHVSCTRKGSVRTSEECERAIKTLFETNSLFIFLVT
jgi:hypothetical protein